MGAIILCGLIFAVLFILTAQRPYPYSFRDIPMTAMMFLIGALIGLFIWVIAASLFQNSCPNENHYIESTQTYELQELEESKYVIYSKNYYYFISDNIIKTVPADFTYIVPSSGQKACAVKRVESSHFGFIRFLFYPINQSIYTLYIPEDSIICYYTIERS